MRRKLWAAGVFGLLGAWSGCSNTDSPGRPQGGVDAGVGGSETGGKSGSGGASAPDGGDSPDASPPGSGGEGGTHTVPPGETVRVKVHGVVRVVDPDGASPLSEPDVTASVDRNGNGKLEAGETVTVTGDETGARPRRLR
jgi:hypothetical protein